MCDCGALFAAGATTKPMGMAATVVVTPMMAAVGGPAVGEGELLMRAGSTWTI